MWIMRYTNFGLRDAANSERLAVTLHFYFGGVLKKLQRQPLKGEFSMPNGPSNHYRKVYRDRRSEAPSYWEGSALHGKRLVPMGHTRPACGDYFCNRAQITLALAEVRLRIENRADDSSSLGGKMNHFKRLLVGAIACAGMVGSVQAQAPDLGTLSPTPVVQTGFFTSASSFADIFNFSIGADHHGFFASAVGLATNGTPTIGTIDNLTLTLFAG